MRDVRPTQSVVRFTPLALWEFVTAARKTLQDFCLLCSDIVTHGLSCHIRLVCLCVFATEGEFHEARDLAHSPEHRAGSPSTFVQGNAEAEPGSLENPSPELPQAGPPPFSGPRGRCPSRASFLQAPEGARLPVPSG